MATEPESLTALLAAQIQALEPDSRAYLIRKSLLDAHSRNSDRRAAVLSHPDLAKRLTQPLFSYARPEQWTGYIPPAFVNLGASELCHSAAIARGGDFIVRYNQLGHRSEGEIPNVSQRRAALLDISREAWVRAHAAKEQA